MKKNKGQPTKTVTEDDLSSPKKQSPWYKNVPIIISVISIAISTIMGIIAIINNRYIARLNNDVYTPRLQYEIGQDTPGKIYFDIVNLGYISAENLLATFSWKDSVFLDDCIVYPPYQDVQPVQPIIQNNITYRLSSLPVNAKLKIECAIYLVIKTNFLHTPSPAELSATPTLWVINITSTPTPEKGAVPDWVTYIPPGMVAIPKDIYENSRLAEKVLISQDLISVNVVADNAKVATESVPRPEIIVAWFEATPIPSTISP